MSVESSPANPLERGDMKMTDRKMNRSKRGGVDNDRYNSEAMFLSQNLPVTISTDKRDARPARGQVAARPLFSATSACSAVIDPQKVRPQRRSAWGGHRK
jgi:hypothetical protein